MAVDYSAVVAKMRAGVSYTAKELGVTTQSLMAMERRGLVKCVADNSPKRYELVEGNSTGEVMALVKKYIGDKEYFGVYKKGASYGMLCRIKNNTIVDCYDKPYDMNGVDRIRVNGVVCKIGKE